MIGLWLEDGELRLREDLGVPEAPSGEVLVRVLRAGICATDHGLVSGMYPFRGILGHEFVGVVDEGPDDLRGRRVVGEINASCGRCERCVRGLGRHCATRTVLGIVNRHGAFAEYLTLPRENLHIVPDNVSNEAAVYTEPLAAALEINEQLSIEPNDRVLVIGDGRLGQLIARTLSLTSCDLVVSGRHERKLGLLSDRHITTISPQEIEEGSYDYAVECTGNSAGFTDARRSLKPRGTLVLKSTYPGQPEIDATMIVVEEITLVGSRCGPFAPALRLLRAGHVDVSDLEDASFPLRDGLKAFERSRERGTLKVTLSNE
ncbi:MAG: alcohol dehydrogenase catalytic domain-containing protein [Planctomycetota bacterium]